VESTSTLLRGFGGTAGTVAHVVLPADTEDVADAINQAGKRGVLARGLGRAYGDAAQNAGGAVLDLTALHAPMAFDDVAGTVRVSAGAELGDVMRRAVARGWFVAVTPGTQHVTVGGAIAADVHGKNHHVDGSFGDHVLELELVDGRGGRRRLVPGEPAFEATCGGLGLTGVITAATLRLLPVETAAIRVNAERAEDLDQLMERLKIGDAAHRYSVAWIDLIAGGRHRGRGIIEHGDHACAEEVAGVPAAVAPERTAAAPGWAPSGLLNRTTARAFNELWFRKASAHAARVVPYSAFFHPLDVVDGWNRLYGAGGFVQYQFVVPDAHEMAVQRAVECVAAARAPVMLAVLKRMGPGRGLLAFPQSGWTLAMDLPARWPGLRALCNEMDGIVAGAGGRVYLAKDGRLSPELLPLMYPELDAWREIRAQLDPDQRFCSDLSRRLGMM
jgi:decaprenylphospho-beta-D-ribofuranose 2-oxidase